MIFDVSKTNYLTESWTEHLLKQIFNLFGTLTLNIDLIPRYTGRARHKHRNSMLPMMTFGITAAGLFIIPMGFQFLAVLAGNALLLSKMALFLASMNGLKRVASSGVHYGLYHTDPHAHGHWDRGDQAHPRSNNNIGTVKSLTVQFCISFHSFYVLYIRRHIT